MSRKENRLKEKEKIKTSYKKIILIVLEIIFIAIMIISGTKIYSWWKDNQKSREIFDNISVSITTTEDGKYEIDFVTLKQTNQDTVAWLKVEGTNIEYPVVKAKDNSYYLNRSFDKTYNSAGWPFADYKNVFDGTDKNIVIYGHNRKDGSMFGSLKDAMTPQWYDNDANKYITFITENEYSRYEVFSVYRIKDEDYYIKTSFGADEFETFVNRLKQRSVKDFGVEVTKDDQILTLSTCSGSDYRVALHAKKVQEEKID